MSNNRIISDKDIAGGPALRGVDNWMSLTFGGSRHGGSGAYANYVEPTFHAAEHTRRAIFDWNGAEWNRAKDELRSVGNGGLVAMENNRVCGGPAYQNGNYKWK